MSKTSASQRTISISSARATHRLKLVGACIAVDGHTADKGEIEIENGHIRKIASYKARMPTSTLPSPSAALPVTVDLSGFLILPGLLNAHDHLEFSLFPRLGNGPYPNFVRWAEDIYHPERSPVREQLAVPKAVRLWWGGIKNLLSGVTTVCEHNPFEPEIFAQDFPVRVVSRYGWAHSIPFEDDIPNAFRATPPEAPFIIHLGEGTDEQSRNEIFILDRLGALDSRTVIVHGVGLCKDGHALLNQRSGALVWCPTSNLFTLGTTLAPQTVTRHSRIILGSDSALTAQGDLLDEVRVAYQLSGLGPAEIYSMVTYRAASVLCLTRGEGTLKAEGVADLIAIKDRGCSPACALVELSFHDVELVMVGGRPLLLSPTLARRWPKEFLARHELLYVENQERLIRAPLEWLFYEAREHLGAEIRLAGKAVNR